MQVFTTIYLAETQGPKARGFDKSIGAFDDECGFPEIMRTNLERIANLEARDWFVDDLPSED